MADTYVEQKIVILNSNNATKNNGDYNSDVVFNFTGILTDDADIKEVQVSVQNAQIPISFYNVNVYNNILRLTYNSVKIMTIPRIGYKHMNLRPGSIFWKYKNGENKITDDEVSFWIESAKKEHFFTTDRNIKFEPQSV